MGPTLVSKNDVAVTATAAHHFVTRRRIRSHYGSCLTKGQCPFRSFASF
jgi:hypothetical protein